MGANEEASRFYRQLLRGAEGEGSGRYFESRGPGDVTRQSSGWHAGYAPRGWTALIDHLYRQGFSDAKLLTAGLSQQTTKGTIVDRFLDRSSYPSIVWRWGGKARSPRDT